MSENQTFEQEIQNYTRKQVAASEFIEIVNELWFNKTVEILISTKILRLSLVMLCLFLRHWIY